MRKKQQVLDLTAKEPLKNRQRRLWAHAEAIEIAQRDCKPLPPAVSEWLHRALKNIAFGQDANEAFNVVPEKRGVRKDSFRSEALQTLTNGYIAAATAPTVDGSKPKKTTRQAIKEISDALPDKKQTTVRNNYNRASTDRKPTFTLGKK
jgi:hypothetical protein